MTIEQAGKVKALWRHPVKSMQGELVESAFFDGRGMQGDRAYAVLDLEAGIVASAKHPSKWARLLTCRAAFITLPEPGEPLPPVRIVFADGREIASTDPRVHAELSAYLGREVRLIAEVPAGAEREADRTEDELGSARDVRQEKLGLAAPGSFLDFAPIHLLSTATLKGLSERAPESRFDVRRFRPNILLDGDGLAEHKWPGSAATIGPVTMNFIDPTPRCVMTTLPQAELPRDVAIFRTAAEWIKAPSITFAPGEMMSVIAGVHAKATNAGVVSVGDALIQ
ncbi:MAG: MOSC domain-containing protein [Sphingomonadales bacterium]